MVSPTFGSPKPDLAIEEKMSPCISDISWVMTRYGLTPGKDLLARRPAGCRNTSMKSVCNTSRHWPAPSPARRMQGFFGLTPSDCFQYHLFASYCYCYPTSPRKHDSSSYPISPNIARFTSVECSSLFDFGPRSPLPVISSAKSMHGE